MLSHRSYNDHYSLISVVLGVQIILGLIVLGGDLILSQLHINPPSLYNLVKSHKMIAGIAIYMGGNMLRGYITKSRAFEIYLGQDLISSFIRDGAVMPVEKLIEIVMKYAGLSSA